MNRWRNLLLGLGFLFMVASLYLIFMHVPTEQTGIQQRIFYFHVPSAWVGFLAFFVVFLASILYLVRREDRWDNLAYSSAEVGVIFTTLVLITGPIWARPTWGVWWTWDVRLTTTLVLWLIYLAYLLVRSYTAERGRAARFAAVVGIVGFIDVPIVALSIVLWRTQHPGPVVFQGGLGHPAMVYTLIISLVTFTLLYILLVSTRVSQRRREQEIEALKGD